MSELAFPLRVRIRQKEDFARVFSHGHFVHGKHMVIGILRTSQPLTRLGVILGKNRYRNATVRNRLRRRCRELFRCSQPQLVKGYDLVVLPRRGLEATVFSAWHREWLRLLRQGKVIGEKRDA